MNKRGRPVGSYGASEMKLRRTLREIITPDQYEEIINGLVDIALNSKSPKARVDATKIIIERMEGALSTVIESSVPATSIQDILQRVDEE